MDAFFNQFHEFLEQLAQVFPDDADFPAYTMALSLLQRTNPGLVVSEFKTHVFPFTDVIQAKNSDFFLKHDFSDYASDDTLGQIIGKLKGMWTELSENNKSSIWNYITLILTLAKRLE
jgi:hypothetical protein